MAENVSGIGERELLDIEQCSALNADARYELAALARSGGISAVFLEEVTHYAHLDLDPDIPGMCVIDDDDPRVPDLEGLTDPPIAAADRNDEFFRKLGYRLVDATGRLHRQ